MSHSNVRRHSRKRPERPDRPTAGEEYRLRLVGDGRATGGFGWAVYEHPAIACELPAPGGGPSPCTAICILVRCRNGFTAAACARRHDELGRYPEVTAGPLPETYRTRQRPLPVWRLS
jgi:hypothetical protein